MLLPTYNVKCYLNKLLVALYITLYISYLSYGQCLVTFTSSVVNSMLGKAFQLQISYKQAVAYLLQEKWNSCKQAQQ